MDNRILSSKKNQASAYSDPVQGLLLIGSAACLIIADNRFWMSISTWMGGAGATIAGGAILLAGALLIVNLIREKSSLRAEFLLPVFAYLLLIGVWGRFGLGDTPISTRSIALAFPIYAVLCLNRRDKIRLLYSVGIVFSIVMGLSAVFFILRYAGISIPYFVLEPSNSLKVAQGMHYEISYLGGSLLNRYGNLNYCGAFDEAGCVGTFSALLFVAVNECKSMQDFRYSRAIKVMLVLEGALSFSFAFVLMMIAYLAICLFRRGDVKQAALVVVVLLAALLVTVVDSQQLGQLGSLKIRLEELFSGGGISNNRVNDQTSSIMREFYYTNDALVSLFGFGQSSFNAIASSTGVDGCSVEFYLFDYGYIGFALYYIVIIILNRSSGRSLFGSWIPLLFFLISTYQRPEVMTSLYLVILMLGSIQQETAEKDAFAHGKSGLARNRLPGGRLGRRETV